MCRRTQARPVRDLVHINQRQSRSRILSEASSRRVSFLPPSNVSNGLPFGTIKIFTSCVFRYAAQSGVHMSSQIITPSFVPRKSSAVGNVAFAKYASRQMAIVGQVALETSADDDAVIQKHAALYNRPFSLHAVPIRIPGPPSAVSDARRSIAECRLCWKLGFSTRSSVG